MPDSSEQSAFSWWSRSDDDDDDDDDVENNNNNNNNNNHNRLGARSTARWEHAQFPRSREEAIHHIEEIRRNQQPRLEDVEFQGMLKELSDGQNSNVFRVLYELLQNADDNHYAHKPRVNIRFRDRYVLFESNEVGFSRDNVDSICHMTMSSKKGKLDLDGRRLIGEKGIGFKTVFMIATSVWVSSGYYTFRFDRNGPLGRIRPIWDDDPPGEDMMSSGYTSIMLKLPDSTERPEDMSMISPQEVVRGMKQLDAVDLLFLSRVKHIDISVENGSDWVPSIIRQSTWRKTIQADSIAGELRTLTDVNIHRDGASEPLVVFRYPISGLPQTSERLNRTTSEIVLAFGQKLPNGAVIPTRRLYAYLPVRDYGFKFVVHSDFVLVSNREDMKPIAWNKALVSHIPHAVVEAITQFKNRHSDLWFKWPLLLPLEGLSGDIFGSLRQDTIKLLTKRRIIEDTNGRIHRPDQVRIIPTAFKSKNGTPLLPPSYSQQNILSEQYPAAVTEILTRHGVRSMSFRSFLTDLETFISNHNAEFASKPDWWHNELCDLLLKNLHGSMEVISRLNLFPLATPLEDGRRWVSSTFRTLYLSVANNKLPDLPVGITGVYKIHPRVKQDTPQSQLLLKLGAKDGTDPTLCQFIISQHTEKDPTEDFLSLTTGDMISHLRFLYMARWKRPGDWLPNFWCACEDGEKRQMSEIYMPVDKMYSARHVSRNSRSKLHFLDPRYISSFQALPNGYEWLMSSVGLTPQLRLLHWEEDLPSLHPHFRTLLADDPLVALNVLRHDWSFYSAFFEDRSRAQRVLVEGRNEPLVLTNSDREKLRHQVSEAMVPCHSTPQAKVVRRLWETYLPRESMLLLCETGSIARCDDSPQSCWICRFVSQIIGLGPRRDDGPMIESDRFLCISDPQDSSWDFLQIFGVFVKPGAQLFINYLKRIRGAHIEHDVAQNLYAQLEKFAMGEAQDMVMKCLMEDKSVYIPNEPGASQGKWMSYDQVVWDGPRSLRCVPRLIDFYETRSQLFHMTLRIPNAGLGALQKEAANLDPGDLSHVRSILQDISRYLELQGTAPGSIPDFSNCQMFPVHPRGSGQGRIELKSISDSWCIPDTTTYQEAFLGHTDVSVLFADEFRSMKQLCTHFNLESRLVSALLDGTSADSTAICEHQDYAKMLQAKAYYLATLIPLELGTEVYEFKLKQLQTMQVFKSKQILIRWKLKVSEEIIHSSAVESRVTSEIRDDTFSLYIVADDDLLVSGYCPIELSHVLSSFCGITNSQDSRLVTQILAQSNHKLIIADLDSHLKEQGRKGRDTTWIKRAPIKVTESPKEVANMSRELVVTEIKSETELESFRYNGIAKWSNSIPPALGENVLDQRGEKARHKQPSKALRKRSPQSLNDYYNHAILDQPPVIIDPILSPHSTRSGLEADESIYSHETSMTSEFDDTDEDGSQAKSLWSTIKTNAATLFGNADMLEPYGYYEDEAIDAPLPRMVQDEDLEETSFYGELYVSQLLESLLGSDVYRPDAHWTSSMRSRNGHRPFEDKKEHGIHSTFKITTTDGKLRKAVVDICEIPDSLLHRVCTFHIQVCTTVGSLDSPFMLPNLQYQKARAMTLSTDICSSDVYILARVYNVQTAPQIALYADPWKLHQEGLMSLESTGDYQGNISHAASAVQVDQCSRESASEPEQIYKGLKVNMGQIRLLQLEPNDDPNAPLKGRLVIQSISSGSDTPTNFWAISYVWGPKPTKLSPFRFLMNNVEIPITESLWTCFRRLRDDRVNVLLWADALCINQKDNVEKSMQVRLMGSIYRKAERVIIWMGNSRSEDIGTFQSLHKYRSKAGPDDSKSPSADSMGLEVVDGERINAFLQRPWFTRTWVIQELALGSQVTIMYGDTQMEWDDFMDGVLTFQEHSRHIRSKYRRHSLHSHDYSGPAYALHRARQASRSASEDSSHGRSRFRFRFLTLVDMFYYTKASKSRDKLFALLSLASDTSINDGPFLPDYESDDEDILARYAAEFVRRGQVYELLHRAGSSKGSLFKSWIPDLMNHGNKLHYAPTISTWKALGTRRRAGFSAGASFSPKASVMYPDTFPTLSITGRIFDIIQSSLPLQLGSGGGSRNLGNIMPSLQRYIASLKFYPDHKKNWQDDVLYKMLIGDAEFSRAGDAGDDKLEVLPGELYGMSPSQDAQNSLTQPDEIKNQIDGYWQTASEFLSKIPNAEACLTTKGYAGIVPGGTRANDLIFVAHGAKVPFLLRRVSDTEYFELLGEVYIHGIMYYETSPVRMLENVEVLII